MCYFCQNRILRYQPSSRSMSQKSKQTRDIDALTFLQLSRENSRLKEQALLKSQKAAAIAHDVSGQLGAVSLLLRKLHRECETSGNTAHSSLIDSVRNSLASIQETTSSLLAEEKQFTKTIIRPVTLGNLFRDIVMHYRELTDQKRLTLKYVDTRLTLALPEAILRRIIENLVRNAIQNTKQGGILLGVKRGKDAISICVVDTGSGFTKEEQTEFLVAFNKGEASNGHGIGLFSVAKLAREHGCQFRIKSQLNIGSNCQLLVPKERFSSSLG